jgi:hypothetical protein
MRVVNPLTGKMNIIYCMPRSALFALDRKQMPSPLPPEKARRCHERREGYEALVREADQPQFVVSLVPNAASTKKDSVDRCMEGNGDWVSVYFMDGK